MPATRVRTRQAPVNLGSSAASPSPSRASSTIEVRSLRLAIEYVPVEQITSSARPVHKHNAALNEQLKSNILRFGCLVPVVLAQNSEMTRKPRDIRATAILSWA